MKKWEWITLDIYDPNSDVDYADLNYALLNDEFDQFESLLSNCYFPFIVRRQVEEKAENMGEEYKRYADPIGVLLLVNEDRNSDLLFIYYTLIESERNLHHMKEVFHIFDEKLKGNSCTEYEWKREYEKLISCFTILHKVPVDDLKLNHLACQSGKYIMNYYSHNYYLFNQQEMCSLEDCKQKILKLDGMGLY